MAYGQTDNIVELREEFTAALNLLLAVAEGTKGQKQVRAWLEKNYSELCMKTEQVKRW